MTGTTAGGLTAKPRASQARPPARDRKAKTLERRASPADLEGTARTAMANRSSISGLIDQAVARFARDVGIADPPPARIS